MILVVCLDDGDGLSFLGRRQSRDREVSAHILSCLEENTLWMEARSAELFPANDPRIRVTDKLPEKKTCADVFFCESKTWLSDLQRFTQVWIYRWNCDYPRDTHFPMEELEAKFVLKDRMDLAGYSHEKIILEVYGLA